MLFVCGLHHPSDVFFLLANIRLLITVTTLMGPQLKLKLLVTLINFPQFLVALMSN